MTESTSATQRILELARRGHDPGPADAQRVRSSLHVRYLESPVLLAPKAALRLPIAGKVALSKILLPLMVGLGAGLAGTTVASFALRESLPASGANVRPARAMPGAKRGDTTPRPAPAFEASSQRLNSPVADGVRNERISPTPRNPLRRVPSPQDMQLELDGLRRAQQLLNSGRATDSLSALDELGHQAPSGALMEERAATRILALCSLGQAQGVEVMEFVARYPHSVHAERMRAVCSPVRPSRD